MNITTFILVLIALQTTYLTARSLSGTRSRIVSGSIICDTSALIDGRIVSIARSGFISSRLIIPRSVVRELQYMADKADHMKRERARYGLDVIRELQGLPGLSVEIYDDGSLHERGVDEQLLQLAQKHQAKLCTIDYNLNKVAQTEQITVVNINELAHALRPMHLPGETFTVTVVAPGQNKDQGVGYLNDGSMVVIDGGKSSLNKAVEVEAVRVLQTEAGRMVFAQMRKSHDASKPQLQKRRPNKAHRPQASDERLVQLANK